MSKKGKNFPRVNQADSASGSHGRYDFDPEDFDTPDVKTEKVRSAKRQKFTKASKSSKNSGFNPLYVAIPAVLVIVLGALLFFQNQSSGGGGAAAASVIQQVPIQMTQADGKITISADEVRNNKLVAFDYKNGSKIVPLTAWVSPSGQIKTAVRMCEPCNSTSFRIEGNVLVCNVCGTRWDLETLRGISGGCTSYPPDAMKNVVNGDNITIDEGPVQAWKRRI